MRLHIGTLTIDLVAETNQQGPLGIDDLPHSGLIFWESDYISKNSVYSANPVIPTS